MLTVHVQNNVCITLIQIIPQILRLLGIRRILNIENTYYLIHDTYTEYNRIKNTLNIHKVQNIKRILKEIRIYNT